MAEQADLKTTLSNARGIISAAWLGARKLNEESSHANETHRQLVTLTSAALDAVNRALKLVDKDVQS